MLLFIASPVPRCPLCGETRPGWHVVGCPLSVPQDGGTGTWPPYRRKEREP